MFYIAPINPGEGLFIKHIRAPSIKNNQSMKKFINWDVWNKFINASL